MVIFCVAWCIIYAQSLKKVYGFFFFEWFKDFKKWKVVYAVCEVDNLLPKSLIYLFHGAFLAILSGFFHLINSFLPLICLPPTKAECNIPLGCCSTSGCTAEVW